MQWLFAQGFLYQCDCLGTGYIQCQQFDLITVLLLQCKQIISPGIAGGGDHPAALSKILTGQCKPNAPASTGNQYIVTHSQEPKLLLRGGRNLGRRKCTDHFVTCKCRFVSCADVYVIATQHLTAGHVANQAHPGG